MGVGYHRLFNLSAKAMDKIIRKKYSYSICIRLKVEGLVSAAIMSHNRSWASSELIKRLFFTRSRSDRRFRISLRPPRFSPVRARPSHLPDAASAGTERCASRNLDQDVG